MKHEVGVFAARGNQIEFGVWGIHLDSVQWTETGISAEGDLTNKIRGYIATQALYRGTAT
jgi:hypothetical protein